MRLKTLSNVSLLAVMRLSRGAVSDGNSQVSATVAGLGLVAEVASTARYALCLHYVLVVFVLALEAQADSALNAVVGALPVKAGCLDAALDGSQR